MLEGWQNEVVQHGIFSFAIRHRMSECSKVDVPVLNTSLTTYEPLRCNLEHSVVEGRVTVFYPQIESWG